MRTLHSCALLALAGCTAFDPIATRTAAVEKFQRDLAARTEEFRAEFTAPLTLADCAATALRNNLEFQLAAFERAAADREFEGQLPDLLPQLSLSGEASYRTSAPYSRSEYLLGGGGIRDSFATATPKDHKFFTAELAWSPLDFGLAWHAREQARLGAMAYEWAAQRVAHRILTVIESAYARSVAADAATALHAEAVGHAEARLRMIRLLHADGGATLAEVAEVSREVATQRELAAANRRSRGEAHAELAAAMGLDPRTTLSLAPRTDVAVPGAPDLNTLVDRALQSRPDLFETDLALEQARIEVTRAWLRRFPNVELLASYNYDDNPYLLYDDYTRVAGRLTLNLVQSILGGRRVAAAEAQALALEQDREVVTLGIVVQVVRAHLELHWVLEVEAAARTAMEAAETLAREYETQAGQGMREQREVRRVQIQALTERTRWLQIVADAHAAAARLSEAAGGDGTDGPDSEESATPR